VLAAQYLLAYFHRVAPAVVASELSSSFSITSTALGVLASAFFYAYMLMQIPVGRLSDTWGPRKTVTLFALVAASGATLFGLAPGYGWAIVGRILVGLGTAAIFVASMKVFAEWFHGREYGWVSGIFLAVGGLGWFLAATPLAVLSEWLGWRSAFVAIGVFTLLLASIGWLLVRDNPGGGEEPVATASEDQHGVSLGRDLKHVLGDRHFWPIAIWFIMTGGAIYAFLGLWAGPYLTTVYGLSKTATGNVLAMVALSMILGAPALGHLSDKTLASRKKVLVGTSVFHCLCWAALLLFRGTLGTAGLYVLFFFFGITSASVGTIAITATKELFPRAIAGTAIGAMNGFPFFGGMLFQPFIGYILDRGRAMAGVTPEQSFHLAMCVFFIGSIVALVSILFSRETIGPLDPRGGKLGREG
jgi:MFS family permease